MCTIVVVQRDRVSLAEESLASLLAHTPAEYPIIYVDGRSPRRWARHLDALAKEGRITLIRTGFYLSQHESYNLAMPHVRTKYVLLTDNDPLYTPGWAENLVKCAEETGASAVIPLYEEKEWDGDWQVHMCGGDCGMVREENGEVYFKEVHPLTHEAIPGDFKRCETGLLEYHALLVRRETLQKVGPFDEGYWFASEHTDFTLMLRAAGGTIWFEPSARIKFRLPPPLGVEDVVPFLTRGNERKVEKSLTHFATKWGVRVHPTISQWHVLYRKRCLIGPRHFINRWFGRRMDLRVYYRFLLPLEERLSRWVQRRNEVPNRRQRLEALGTWRGPVLDDALVEAFAQKMLREPRPLGRELTALEDAMAQVER